MNPEVLKELPQVDRPRATYANISRLDGKGTWKFLLMPTEITYDSSANYTPSNSVGISSPTLQWTTTDNISLSIGNLPISGRSQRRVITKYVNDLMALIQPIAKGKPPAVLSFVWGQTSHSPCVMTRFSKVERSWYPNGDLAECSVSFTLVKVPTELLVDSY